MFETFFPRGWMRGWDFNHPLWRNLPTSFEGKSPRVDVIERDNEIVVHAEVPGVEKKDLDVSLSDNRITIKGSTSSEEKEEKGDFFRREISRGSFARTVTLPGDVDIATAKAKFKDGILEVTIQKKEQSKRHSVTVD